MSTAWATNKLYKIAIEQRKTPEQVLRDTFERYGNAKDAAAALGMTRQGLWKQLERNFPHLIDEYDLPQRVSPKMRERGPVSA